MPLLQLMFLEPLFHLCKRLGDIRVAKLLIQYGADVMDEDVSTQSVVFGGEILISCAA
jgi:hypothetical protein